MPLPALPANSTNRLFLDYNDTIHNHTAVIRYGDGFQPSDLEAWLVALLESLEPAMVQGWAVTGARYQEAGSIVTFPAFLPDVTGFTASGSQQLDAREAPRQTVFVGRGRNTGRRVRLGFFGLVYFTPGTYRFDGLLPSWATNTLNTLDSESVNFGITIGGDAPTWYRYVNVNYNSYWETEARG